MNGVIKLEPQKIYAFAVAYMLSFSGLLNLINSTLNIIGLNTALDTIVLYGLMIIIVLIGISMFLIDNRHAPIDVMVVVSAFVFLYAFSYMLSSSSHRYLVTSFLDYAKNPLYLVFLYSLPGYIFARKLYDYECLKKILIKFSYVIVILSVAIFFFGGDTSGRQYMTLSYNMLLQLFVLLFHKPTNFRNFHRLILFSGIFVFVFGGARGALVAFVVSVLLYKVQTTQMDRKKITTMSFIVLIVIVYAALQKYIVLFLLNVLEKFSIQSRTFYFIVNGMFLNDSQRLMIYGKSLNAINMFGYGMRSDRVFLDGGYVHNLFIELWFDFGWILGTVIIAILVIVLLNGINNTKRPEHFYVLMLLSNGFIALMLSGSYLNQSPAFFILFGFCVNSIVNKRRQRKTDKDIVNIKREDACL